MSRFGVRYLLVSKLHHIDGYAFTSALYLINANLRGYAYTKDETYKEHHKDRILTLTPDDVTLKFADGCIEYSKTLIRMRFDKEYSFTNNLFAIGELGNIHYMECYNGEWWTPFNRHVDIKLSDPDNLWTSIQEMISWAKSYPKLAGLLEI